MTAITRFLTWLPLAMLAFLPGQPVSSGTAEPAARRAFIGPAEPQVFAAQRASAPAAETPEVTVRDGMTIVTVPESRRAWLQARRDAEGEIHVGHGVGDDH
ncbi:MAG: hypothetical protein RJQ08_01545 [Salinisphaeraceae bacterium]